jgi:VWFA-related protein
MLRLPIRMALVFSLILSLAASSVTVSAQQAGSSDIPAITIRANTRLVTVDVVVTDKKGQPITGLKLEDFTLEENGKKQKVSIFVPPGVVNQSATEPLPPGLLSNRPEYVSPGGPLTVLVLDVANSPFKDQAYARSQMLKYVVEHAQTGQPMAILALTTQLQVLQQFTSDPNVLLAAIKKYKPSEQPNQSNLPRPISGGSGGGVGGQGGGALDASIAQATSRLDDFQNIQVGAELERRTLITIEAMRSLARMLGGLQGRKNVVWLAADLPFDLIPENRNVSEAELAADLPSIQQKSGGVIASGAQASEQRMLHGPEIKAAEAGLAAASIAVYPVDIRGLVSGTEFMRDDAANRQMMSISAKSITRVSSVTDSQETMREIAAETGGKAYVNQNEIKDGVAMAVADGKASYTLGYYPENKKWDGKFRSIKVKVSQGDTQVRNRKGYFAIDPTEEKDRKDDQDVAAALQINGSATQVVFKAQAQPTGPGKMRVVFLVDAHTLSGEDSKGGKRLNVTLYATVYDSAGKRLGQSGTKVDRVFEDKTYQQVLEKGMLVPIDMDLPAGGTEVRLAVLDNKTGFIGTVTGPVGQ